MENLQNQSPPKRAAKWKLVIWIFLLGVLVYCGKVFLTKYQDYTQYQKFEAYKTYKFGCIDRTGKLVIEPIFDEIAPFESEFACVRYKGRAGYIDKNGTIAIACQFDKTSPFSDGLAAVKIKDFWGYIDKTGQLKIPARYDSAESFLEGLAAIRKGSLWGFIDKSGIEIIAPKFQAVSGFRDGLAQAKTTNGKCGFIDRTGAWKFAPNFDETSSFRHGLCRISVGGKCGVMNSAGVTVLPPTYDYVGYYADNGLAPAVKGKRWGFIDRMGKLAIPFNFDEAHIFFESMAAVRVNNKWGFIDNKGQYVVPPKYYGICDYSCGNAIGWVPNTTASPRICNYEILDASGKTVAGDFALAYAFIGGFAPVTNDLENWNLVDTRGVSLFQTALYEPGRGENLYFSNDRLVVRRSSKTKIESSH